MADGLDSTRESQIVPSPTEATSRDARFVLCCEELPRRAYHRVPDVIERAFDQRTRRACVASTAEQLRELVHIHRTYTAERDLNLVVSEIAEEHGQPSSANRARMLRDSFEILRPESVLLRGSG